MNSSITSSSGGKEKCGIDVKAKDFDYKDYFKKKRDFVRLYHDKVCSTKTGYDIRGSSKRFLNRFSRSVLNSLVKYLWGIICEKNIPSENWDQFLQVFRLNRNSGILNNHQT
jgi:hypothetical protein